MLSKKVVMYVTNIDQPRFDYLNLARWNTKAGNLNKNVELEI